MKILLKHKRESVYVQGRGSWTADPCEAHDFQHSRHAIDFAHENGLTAVQIAVRFIDADTDEVFPIPVAAVPIQPSTHV